MAAPVPIQLKQVPPNATGWMRGAARSPNPPMGQGYVLGGGVPLELQPAQAVSDWMRPAARSVNPPPGQGYVTGGNVPVATTWGHSGLRPVARLPNPPMGQGYVLGGNVPVTPQMQGSGLRGVARRPNPAPNPSLDGWYPSTSTVDYQKNGAPVAGPWVEQLDPQLPSMGLLHRKGQPDVKVQIMWNAGCQLKPRRAHVCTVFVKELSPADLIRFRLPNGYQGRAKAHRTYKTPMGNVTHNPRAILKKATYKKAWLPASFTTAKPSGIRGSWVQVSPADSRVGLVHIPGIGTQQAYVFSVKTDAYGRRRALVRWKQVANPRKKNNGGDAYVVQTSVDKSKWYCRIMPHMADCVRKDITHAREKNPGNGKPLGTVRASRPVSAAAARAAVPTGGIVNAIRSGRARVVFDRGGIRLVAA